MNKINRIRVSDIFIYLVLALGIAQPLRALPASLKLATKPLANSTTTTVLPNLMFVLDSSGSMDWNYLPDWVNDNLCKNTDGDYDRNCTNSPLFRSPDVNGVYYNPDIRYRPPVKFDGKSYDDQTSWTSVKDDAYGIQSNNSTNLVTDYVDVEWCTNTNYTDCLRNDNYILPGTVNGKTYTVSHNTTSTGTGSVATGSPSNPTTPPPSRTFGPHYYRVTPGEYCTTSRLNDCQRAQDAQHTFPARVRWCTSESEATAVTPSANACQALRTSTYKSIRFPTKYPVAAQSAIPAVPAKATFSFSEPRGSDCDSSHKAGIATITVNGVNILSSATSNVKSASDLASAIRGKTANGGYSFSGSGSTVTITAPVSAGDVTYVITMERTSTSNRQCTFTPMSAQLGGYVAATPALPESAGAFVRTDIVSGATFPRGSGRTDCKADPCSYTEEMTNFANWWTYYQTRMQTMKTATSLAFKSIDSRYRVGFIDIYGTNYLPIATFISGSGNAKDLWYQKLVSMNPNGGTPLRSALARIGQLYAGLKPVGSADPVQYSCQQNFTLLTTDGYWNGDVTGRNNTTTGVNDLNGNLIGNRDGGDTPRPMNEGPTASSNSLADVAKYYYDTDLRTSALSNCKGGEGVDVCANDVFVSGTDNNQKQHMTTFTLGLGVDGSLLYRSDYKTATSGDYYDITKGAGATPNWPVPVADTETAVDDLWHAAVNGQGTYFSAKDPSQLTSGLNAALNSIGSQVGAGSAAATSSLNPVAGDNYAYVASYTTVKWQGNLEARTINLTTGDVSQTPQWCVEDTVTASCPGGTITSSTAGNSTTYYCSTPNSTADTCTNGTLNGTTCNVEVPKACVGTMRSTISATNDTRTIKMSDGNGSLVDFTYDHLSTDQRSFFTGTGLSQWADLNEDQQKIAAGNNLVAYLRGQNGFEDQAGNAVVSRLYRYREATLGDITESQPQFLGKPVFKYTDAGYADYAKIARPKTVFVGANDGMLHAFNADDGTERWAFVPSAIIPNLWRLADRNYSTMHTNYVNGRPVVGDVYDAAQKKWRTILVAGLNGGGRAYYALDVTDPTNPALLWEIDSSTESNLGYSYGYPVITKDKDGNWVVLLTSGYNNTNPGDGWGHLFIRDALTGKSVATIDTNPGEKDTDTPSGLARISNYGDDPMHNNASVVTYGGDLLGNLWRFDINAKTVTKLAILKDSAGNPQPITAAPELGLAYGKRVVFVGTGKYLEEADLEDKQQQSLYAIKDANITSTLGDLRSLLKKQTITADGATRTSSNNPVNLATDAGWYIDWPDSGERENVDPLLDAGLLIAPTTVPSNTICQPGGYGWLNYFNYLNGANDDGIVSQKYNAPIVGINVYYTPDGKRHVSVVTSDHPTPEQPSEGLPNPPNQFNFQGKRVIWRELIP